MISFYINLKTKKELSDVCFITGLGGCRILSLWVGAGSAQWRQQGRSTTNGD